MRIWKRYVIFTLFIWAGHFFLESDKWLIGTRMHERLFDLAFVLLVIGCTLWYTWHESNTFKITASDILPEDPEEGWKMLERNLKKKRAERRWEYTLWPSQFVFAFAIVWDMDIHGISFPLAFCIFVVYAVVFIQLMLREPNKLLR